MNAAKTICIVIINLVFFCEVSGQQRRALKRYEKAVAAFEKYENRSCLSLSRDLVADYPTFSQGWLLLGKCAGEMGYNTLAYTALRRYFSLDSLSFPEIAIEIAEISITLGRYEEGLSILNRYESIIQSKNLPKSDSYSFVSRQLKFALDEIKKDVLVAVEPLGLVNSNADEYFPSVTVDGKVLVFTRQEIRQKQDSSKQMQEDLFLARLNTEGSDSGIVIKLPYPLNTVNNEGTQAIRQDGRVMFFTACNRPDTKGGCDLYQSIRIGDQWSEPFNLGYPINTRYWESTPCLSPNGTTLYFSSNRPGGEGGMDIWMSHYLDAKGWTEPINLGSIINTPDDEMAPFLHGDGYSLFFSSNGRIGMGNLDLYVAHLEGSSWAQPINLGYPINTFANEFGLSVVGDGLTAFFSSDRDSISHRDIYTFSVPIEWRPSFLISVSGMVLNEITLQPIAATITVVRPDGTVLQTVQADQQNGEYLVGLPVKEDVVFIVHQPGYLYYSQRIGLDSIHKESQVNWPIFLKPLKVGDSKILENIFFSFDSADITDDSEAEINELSRFMDAHPDIGIDISGHTDNLGSEEYNANLSLNRANALRDRLISLGTPAHRIHAEGFGAKNPIADNTSESGRAKNRRIEIKVVKLH